MRHPDRNFERDQLLDWVWGRSTYIEIRTIDVSICDYAKRSSPSVLMEPFKPLTVCATDSRQSLSDSLAVSPDIASERNAFRQQAASQILMMFWQHASY